MMPFDTGFFMGTTNCLSALVAAERYDDVLGLLELAPYQMWHYRRYGVTALSAKGKKAEAIRYAEDGRGLNDSPVAVARACEEVLLSSGLTEEAYRRYGLVANQAGTHLATFRAVSKKYPHKAASEILADLVQTTPGDEGNESQHGREAQSCDGCASPARAARLHGDLPPVLEQFAHHVALALHERWQRLERQQHQEDRLPWPSIDLRVPDAR